jgi:hypothetical protein
VAGASIRVVMRPEIHDFEKLATTSPANHLAGQLREISLFTAKLAARLIAFAAFRP